VSILELEKKYYILEQLLWSALKAGKLDDGGLVIKGTRTEE
jgi:hypothetical protein